MTRILPKFPKSPPWGSIEAKKLVEARINGGMVTSIDPADLDNSQGQYVKNMRMKFDKAVRRGGYTKLYTGAYPGTLVPAPDANNVLAICTFKDKTGQAVTCRFTKSAVYKLVGNAWIALTGALAGGNSDRIKPIVIGSDFFFSNNGANKLQKINVAGNSFADNGNADHYKYATGFYERLVGAHILNSDGTAVGWSGQKNTSEFNGGVDISAGIEFLIESPSDLGDLITGIYGLTNYLVIPRERSIWVATKNPQPQKPFNFYNAAPGIGTNLPYSVAVWESGIIFADSRTGTVWFYSIGGTPDSIGRPNDKSFSRQLSLLSNPDDAFASYDPVENEYTLMLPSGSGSTIRAWTFNFRTKAWNYEEYPSTFWSLQDTEFAASYTSIDELLGTIDGLVGTIDSLSSTAKSVPLRMVGLTTGDILREARDAPSIDTDDGIIFDSQWVSKNFQLASNQNAISFLRIGIQSSKSTTFNFYFATDGGLFGDEMSPVVGPYISFVSTRVDEETEIFTIPLNARCRQFKFKLQTDSGQFKIVEYEVHTFEVGRSIT